MRTVKYILRNARKKLLLLAQTRVGKGFGVRTALAYYRAAGRTHGREKTLITV